MFRAGKRIALYLPFDRETDTSALVAAARRRGVRVFVPVIVDRRHARIRFYPLDSRTRSGVFGISVPSRLTRPVSPPMAGSNRHTLGRCRCPRAALGDGRRVL